MSSDEINWENLSETEKKQYLTSEIISSKGKELEIVKIIQSENDSNMLKMITDQLEESDFTAINNLEAFIDLAREIPVKKRDIIWNNIILRLVLKAEDEEKLLLVVRKLVEEEDTIIKYEATRFYETTKIFSRFPRARSAFYENCINRDGEVAVYEMEVTTTEDVVEKTLDMVKRADRINRSLFGDKSASTKLMAIMTTLKENVNGNRIDKNDLIEFVEQLFNIHPGFEEKKELIDLYKQFIKIEDVLLVSIGQYRDHVSHTLRVFLLGLQILIISRLSPDSGLPEKHELEEFLSWCLSAFFHDVGYGIEKLDNITADIKESFEKLGTVQTASFSLKESTRIFAGRIIDEMDKMLQPRSDDYNYITLKPLLTNLDEKKHGLMSGIIFLNKVDEMFAKDYKFSKLYGDEMGSWTTIFLKAALAMTLHTFPETYNRGINLERDYFHTYKEYFFPSFLLTVIDSIEYMDRPIFRGFRYEEGPLIRDIKMKNLKISVNYSNKDYYHLIIIIEYERIDKLSDLLKIAEQIKKHNIKYISEKWGVTIILHKSENVELRFPLLRREEEKFRKFYGRIRGVELDYERDPYNVQDTYKSFLRNQLESLDLDDEEREKWGNQRTSSQIFKIISSISQS